MWVWWCSAVANTRLPDLSAMRGCEVGVLGGACQSVRCLLCDVAESELGGLLTGLDCMDH